MPKVEYALPATVPVPRHSMFASGGRAKRNKDVDERRKQERLELSPSVAGDKKGSSGGGSNGGGGNGGGGAAAAAAAQAARLAALQADPAFAAQVASAWGKILGYLHDDGARTTRTSCRNVVGRWNLRRRDVELLGSRGGENGGLCMDGAPSPTPLFAVDGASCRVSCNKVAP